MCAARFDHNAERPPPCDRGARRPPEARYSVRPAMRPRQRGGGGGGGGGGSSSSRGEARVVIISFAHLCDVRQATTTRGYRACRGCGRHDVLRNLLPQSAHGCRIDNCYVVIDARRRSSLARSGFPSRFGARRRALFVADRHDRGQRCRLGVGVDGGIRRLGRCAREESKEAGAPRALLPDRDQPAGGVARLGEFLDNLRRAVWG